MPRDLERNGTERFSDFCGSSTGFLRGVPHLPPDRRVGAQVVENEILIPIKSTPGLLLGFPVLATARSQGGVWIEKWVKAGDILSITMILRLRYPSLFIGVVAVWVCLNALGSNLLLANTLDMRFNLGKKNERTHSRWHGLQAEYFCSLNTTEHFATPLRRD